MLGFEITTEGGETDMAISDCEAWILVDYFPEADVAITLGRWDFSRKALDEWWRFKKIPVGSKIKIRFTEISEETPVVITEFNPELQRRPSKLEMFRQLEQVLKNEGVEL